MFLMYCDYKRVWWLLSKHLSSVIVFKQFPKHDPICLIMFVFLGKSEDKVKAIQEKLDVDDKHSSGERNETEKRW